MIGISHLSYLTSQKLQCLGPLRSIQTWFNLTEEYKNYFIFRISIIFMENKNKEKDFWEEEYFYETMDSIESKEKLKTFHKGHDEDMNFNCKNCDKKISAHNKDWHAGLCDDCFNRLLSNWLLEYTHKFFLFLTLIIIIFDNFLVIK